MALALLAGCGGVDAATTSPSPSGSVGTGSGIGSTEATTPQPADPGTPPTEQTVAPTDDLAYDPIPRTVTGVVERPAGCTVLVVGQNRFVLSGDMAATLTVGSRMTVTGNLTFRPSTCPGETGQVLQVIRAIPA